MADVKNVARYVAKLKACAPAVLKRMVAADDKLADQGVAQIKAIAPVDPKSKTPGAYRDSVRKEASPKANSVRIVAGAPGFAQVGHLEYGHKTPGGGHVRAEPSFWPVIRKLRKTRKSRQRSAIKAGLKEATS